MMLQILSLALIQTVLICQSTLAQTICIWGRIGYNNIINGHYTETNTYNNKPYYLRAAAPSCDNFYIYWKYDQWNIDNILGNSLYYAFCNSSLTLSNCHEWFVWNNGWNLDSEVTLSTGECPTWSCDAITIPNAPNGCDSFNVSLGNNVWKNSANTRWWYFDPKYFAWYCNEYYPTYSCDDSYWTWSEEGWTDLPKGQSISIQLEHPSTETYTLNCVGTQTNIPTVIPTVTPTVKPTNTPTDSPTTDSPTVIPTVIPTISPVIITTTNMPTASPTVKPTNMPTNTPTDTPTTDSPTVIPTVIPTESPHQNPTVTPTFNPTVHIQSSINPTSSKLSATNKGDNDEGSVVDTTSYTTRAPILSDLDGYKKDNSSFWIVIIVFLVLMLVCIMCLVVVFVYKHKKDKETTDINVKNAINNKQQSLPNVPRMMSRDRVHTHSHYIDDDAKEEAVVNNTSHIHIQNDIPEIIHDDATPNDYRNSSELDMHDNYSMETPGNINMSNFPSASAETLTIGNDDNTKGVLNEQEGNEDIFDNSVKQWLDKQVKLPQYYDNFIENGYDTLEIIIAITDNSELEEIGINLKGHIRKTMTEIKKLQKKLAFTD